jgi:hypothetical protein
MGFVCAATISSLYQWITSEQADFFVNRRSVGGIVVAILLSMFGGPFIVMRKVLVGVRTHEVSVVPAALGVLVVAMWSVCAGIFYVSLLVSA